jgi:hypothetical protein
LSKRTKKNRTGPRPSKSLLRAWEQILAKEGLSVIGREPNPYQSGTVGHDPITREAKAEYYRLMSAFTRTKRMATKIDRIIMDKIVDGSSYVDVSRHLKQLKLYVDRKDVRKVVAKYEQRWKVVSRG